MASAQALALEFKASQPPDADSAIEEEQREMMRALCSSVHGKDDLFRCVRGWLRDGGMGVVQGGYLWALGGRGAGDASLLRVG